MRKHKDYDSILFHLLKCTKLMAKHGNRVGSEFVIDMNSIIDIDLEDAGTTQNLLVT